MTKTCTKCGETKSREDFNKRAAVKDGLRSRCKICDRAEAAKWKSDNLARASENTRKWKQDNADKVSAYNREYHANNQEARRQHQIAWHEQNRGRHLATSKEWKRKNAERVAAYAAEWRKNNLHLKCAQEAKRRSAKAAFPLNADQKAAVKHIYAFAKYLSKKFNKSYHVDHIVPLKGENVSGLHVPWNLQVLPAATNLSKSNKH